MLKGKVAVVTGASRGIGAAVAKKLASLGADLALIYAGKDALAEAAAARLGLRAVPLLRRRRGSSGHTQRGLNREKRILNVRNAFEPAVSEGEMPRSVLLVDDVLTTGATLRACEKALRAAGAERIRAVTATAAGRAARRRPEEEDGMR